MRWEGPLLLGTLALSVCTVAEAHPSPSLVIGCGVREVDPGHIVGEHVGSIQILVGSETVSLVGQGGENVHPRVIEKFRDSEGLLGGSALKYYAESITESGVLVMSSYSDTPLIFPRWEMAINKRPEQSHDGVLGGALVKTTSPSATVPVETHYYIQCSVITTESPDKAVQMFDDFVRYDDAHRPES